jgi:hypothetical protein
MEIFKQLQRCDFQDANRILPDNCALADFPPGKIYRIARTMSNAHTVFQKSALTTSVPAEEAHPTWMSPASMTQQLRGKVHANLGVSPVERMSSIQREVCPHTRQSQFLRPNR